MATPKRKVKSAATKRLKITLEKTVTLRLTSVVEVEVPALHDNIRGVIEHAADLVLANEQQSGHEREWLTEKVDANDAFSVNWASIQEIEPHITECENAG